MTGPKSFGRGIITVGAPGKRADRSLIGSNEERIRTVPSERVKGENTELFASVPVPKAILSLAVPTVISQLVFVIYNIADTFFIGQLGDPDQVAAATIALPFFIFGAAFSNLFGIGGSGVIARNLGIGNVERAKKCASFCLWTAVLLSLAYSIFMVFFHTGIFYAFGANEASFDYCERYVFWTIELGTPVAIFGLTFAHLFRAEGYSKQAGFGSAAGGIINIILDPIFIFGFDMEIVGAAVATFLSHVIVAVYFIILYIRKRKKMTVTISPRYYSGKNRICLDVITVGLPSFLMSFLAATSNAMTTHLMGAYSNGAIAGMGIAKKIDSIAFGISQGMAQGVLPLIAFNYGSGNKERMNRVIRTVFLYTVVIGLAGMAFLFFGAVPLARSFIDDAITVDYAAQFLKIFSVACPLMAVNFMVINVFQATGKRIAPLILSFMRKGAMDIPLMILFSRLIGESGIVLATPVSEVIGLAASVVVILYMRRKQNNLI